MPLDTGPYVHRFMCAAYVNGCESVLMWGDDSRAVEPDAKAVRLLTLNGWRLDGGKWVCGRHEPPPKAAIIVRRCACGCGERIGPWSPSPHFATEACRELWEFKQRLQVLNKAASEGRLRVTYGVTDERNPCHRADTCTLSTECDQRSGCILADRDSSQGLRELGPRCIECVEPDEDPAQWCDCRPGETCRGPCRRRAHSPERCPTPGRW